jgi:hypothetical protein
MSGNIRNRRNWTRSLTVVMLVTLIGALIGCLANKGEKKADRVFLQNSAGAVLFDHERHKGAADSCAQCHHDLYTSVQATPCEDCHDDGFVTGDYNHADLKEIHSLDCAKCHEQGADNEQAASCRQCHPTTQKDDKLTNNCMECHDDNSFSSGMMEHDEYAEVDEHSCIGCHSPRSVSEAYHANCTKCHLETLPDRFANAGGDVRCGACHLR